MNYGLIYTIPFATLDNSDCIVEIEKKGYTGVSTELTGGASPFVVDIADDEFAYTPLRFSTATINVVGGDYLQELFSTAYQQYRVTLKKNGNITWCGFVKPELYTQDYSSEIFTLELECISAMSTLEFIDYTQSEESGRKFVSLWDLIKKCIDSSSSQYNAVYFPQVYGKDASDVVGGNILKEMTVSEQNFFDEDNKPMKLKEVLEEICKFLHWTCADWCGSLYFVDIDHKGNYSRYPSDLSQKSGEESISVKSVQDIGFAGSEHSLDVLPGYNKVTVKCSNYPVGKALPEEKYSNKNVYDSYKTINDDYTEETYAKGVILSSWQLKAYGQELGGGGIYKLNDDQIKRSGARINYNMTLGATAYKIGTVAAEKYMPKNGTITYKIKGENYAWNNVIRCRMTDGIEDKPLLVIKGGAASYSEGAIGINAGILFTTVNGSHSVNASEVGLWFRLRIGEYFWAGTTWVHAPKGSAHHNNIRFRILTGKSNEIVEKTGLRSNKTADMPYEGLTGYIVTLPDRKVLVGDMELTLFSSKLQTGETPIHIVNIYNLRLSYQKKDNASDEDNNSDRIYENVINESYINELDEIETKISSYNNDGACYSKVILNDGYLTDNLYSSIERDTIRPEELLIRRIIHRYSAPQIKLTQVIKATSGLTPISVLSDRFMTNKKFINAGGTIDFKMNRFNCIMIEK